METFSAFSGGFPSQKSVRRSFDVFFDLNKRLSEQSGRRWSGTSSRSLWRHCNVAINADVPMFTTQNLVWVWVKFDTIPNKKFLFSHFWCDSIRCNVLKWVLIFNTLRFWKLRKSALCCSLSTHKKLWNVPCLSITTLFTEFCDHNVYVLKFTINKYYNQLP